MELGNKFAQLSETFIAELSDSDDFYKYFHILAFVSGFDKSGAYRFFSSSSAPIVNLVNLDTKLLQEIKTKFPFSIKDLSESDRKDLSKFYLEKCLQIERKIKNSPENYEEFLGKLSLIEPEAISKKKSNYIVSFGNLSPASQKKYLDWEIKNYFYYKTPIISQNLAENLVMVAQPKDGQIIYNPNCNIGSIFVAFYKKFPNLEFQFKGNVGRQYQWLFCVVNLYVNGIFDDRRITVDIEFSDSFEDVSQKYFEFKAEDDFTLREDFAEIAISVVPLSEKFSEQNLDSRFFAFSYSLKKPEYAYLELLVNATTDYGKAIAIVPDNVLYSTEGRFFREAYLSRDWIESVTSLPENSFNQTDLSEFSIVVFNKNKSEKGFVIFDGEGNEFERTEIKNDTILSENDVDLRAGRYALKEIKSIRNTIERHQERDSQNSVDGSTENVALYEYFDNLAEIFSKKFPTVKNTVYLYLLVVVVRILDWSSITRHLGGTSTIINSKVYQEIEEFIFAEYYNKIISLVFDELQNNKLWFEINVDDIILSKYGTLESNTPFKGRFRELCKYLINKCLDIKNSVQVIDKEKLIIELAKRAPKAVKINSDGSFKSMEILELSDMAFQEYSEAVIAQSFYFENNLLECFTSLDKILAEIADPKPEQEIFIPNCGIGNAFVELHEKVQKQDLWFTGNVFDEFFHFLCEANLLANDIRGSIIYQAGYLDEWAIPDNSQKYDIAMGIVPLNMVITGGIDKKFFKLSHNRKNLEYSFIELLINSLNETGKAVVVVPEKFLYTGHAKGFKKEYLENDWVESVISLPESAFGEYGAVKASIIIFNKNKVEKGFITFKSLDSQFEETEVSLDEILYSGSLDLRADRYASKEVKELKLILSKYPQDEVKKIKDLIDSSISGFNYSPKNRIVENSTETLPYVRVKDLSNNDKDFTLDISKVERKISPEKVTHKRTVIDFSAVLVSKIAPNLKPTLFNFINQPIVIGSDVVALKVKESVNVEYFLTQLYSQLVKIQVEMMSSGNTINRISTQDFLNIQIVLPPLEEQQRQILETRGLIAEKKSVEEKIVEAQFEVVASINHSLKNKLAVVINDYDTLLRFLRRKERKSETIIFSDAISANAIGDDIDTIEIITNRLKTNLSDASKVFNNALKIQRQNLKKDVVELVKFFKEEVRPLYAGKNFSIEVNVKPNLKLNVWLDKDAFKDVIENLIENAKSHGFINDEKNYRIVFDLSKLKDEDDFDGNTSTKYARIVYKNDGKPFPQNFSFEDYKQFSNKAGKTQGTGIGGYVINKMIELHDGRFNFIYPSDDFTVEFEILLPLEN